jgi:hypothetical protein
MMEKFTRYFDDFGPVGGTGIVCLLVSWALVVADLSGFDRAGLARLTPVQLTGTLLAALGILLVIYRLKQRSVADTKSSGLIEADKEHWDKLTSFLQDRRSLHSLMDYEHLSSLMKSVDEIRRHLADELQQSGYSEQFRATLEQLQEACRTFDDAWARLFADAADRGTVPSHVGELTPPIMQYQLCTTVGILRGQFAAIVRNQVPDSVGGSRSLVAKMAGGRIL